MGINELHQYTALQLTMNTSNVRGAEDLSSASAVRLLLTLPDSTVATYFPTFQTDGTDGKLETLVTFDAFGLYRAQLRVQFPQNTIYSDIQAFRVFPTLCQITSVPITIDFAGGITTSARAS